MPPPGDGSDRPPDDPGRLLTLTEAASLYGYSREALRLRVRRGRLPSVRGNDGVTRVKASDLLDMPPPTTVDRVADHQSTASDLLGDGWPTNAGETQAAQAATRRAEVAEARLASLEAEAREARETAAQARVAQAITETELAAERRRADAAEAKAEGSGADARRLMEEAAQLRERIARAEAEREAAEVARRALEATAARAERRQDALEDELRQSRRPLWEKLAEFVRRR